LQAATGSIGRCWRCRCRERRLFFTCYRLFSACKHGWKAKQAAADRAGAPVFDLQKQMEQVVRET
jgi:hypothetical protein